MWGDDEDDDIAAAIKASLSVNTESPRAALDNVHHKVQQRYNEEINRTVRFRTKREVEKAHSLYLQSSALDHNKLQEAKSAVNFWVKKNSLKLLDKRPSTRTPKPKSRKEILQQHAINSPPLVSRAAQAPGSSSPHSGATYDPIVIAGSGAESHGDSSVEEMEVVPSRCPVYNCEVPFQLIGTWEEKVVAYSDHMSSFDHSPCSPFLNMPQKAGYLKTMAKLSIAQACPQCGMLSKSIVKCREHQIQEEHLIYMSPVTIIGFGCPQCLLVFPNRESCSAHISKSNHTNILYSFKDDAHDVGEPVPFPRLVCNTFNELCKSVGFSVECIDCMETLARNEELTSHFSHSPSCAMKKVMATAEKTPADVFCYFLKQYSCDQCLRLFNRHGIGHHHKCIDSEDIQGTIVENSCSTFTEFVRRSALIPWGPWARRPPATAKHTVLPPIEVEVIQESAASADGENRPRSLSEQMPQAHMQSSSTMLSLTPTKTSQILDISDQVRGDGLTLASASITAPLRTETVTQTSTGSGQVNECTLANINIKSSSPTKSASISPSTSLAYPQSMKSPSPDKIPQASNISTQDHSTMHPFSSINKKSSSCTETVSKASSTLLVSHSVASPSPAQKSKASTISTQGEGYGHPLVSINRKSPSPVESASRAANTLPTSHGMNSPSSDKTTHKTLLIQVERSSRDLSSRKVVWSGRCNKFGRKFNEHNERAHQLVTQSQDWSASSEGKSSRAGEEYLKNKMDPNSNTCSDSCSKGKQAHSPDDVQRHSHGKRAKRSVEHKQPETKRDQSVSHHRHHSGVKRTRSPGNEDLNTSRWSSSKQTRPEIQHGVKRKVDDDSSSDEEEFNMSMSEYFHKMKKKI